MSPSRKTAVNAGLGALVVAALCWLAVGTFRGRGPYSVDSVELSGWTLVTPSPDDPALVALQPPPSLSTGLFQQLFRRTGEALVAPAHPSVPLVLRSEYADSLQGVLSVEDILNKARDLGLETARFEPICMGRRRESAPGRSDTLFFVLFDAPAFDEFREELTPLFPEHAGAFPYEPRALSPILAIGATDRQFERWWPLAVKAELDCRASLRVTN